MTRPLPPRPTHTRLYTTAGIASILLLLALLGGVPAALYMMAGWPLPDHIPTWTQTRDTLSRRDNGELFLATLTVLAWAAWALLAILVAVEATAQLRGRSAPHLPRVLAPAQHGISLLVASILALTIPTTTADRAEALPPPVAAPATPHPSTPHTATAPAAQPAAPYQTYVVQHRDTLWGIAERILGDGHRFGEIARLSYDIRQPDGRTLGHDHQIWPGWTLRIPTTRADSPAGPTHVVQPGETLSGIAADELGEARRYPEIARLNAGRPQPDGRALADPDLIRPGWRLALPTTTPSSPRPPAPPPPRTGPPPTPPAAEPTPAPSHITTPHGGTEHPAPDDHGGVSLPSGALVGMSLAAAITAALAAARLHRRRTYRPSTPGHTRPDPPSPLAAQTLERTSPTTGADADREPAPPAAGLHGTTSIDVETLAIGGLALIGPGAHDAIRASLVACIAGPHTDVVITTADLQTLLDQVDEPALGHLDNLVVVADIREALALAEAETTHRMRLLDDAEPDTDLATLRRDHPDEPLPTLLIITATEHPVRNRLGAILATGQRIGIGAILTGDWPDITTYTVDPDGHLHHPHTAGSTPVDRLFHLPPTDATDLLGVLAAARGAPTPAAPANSAEPAQPPPAHSPAPAAAAAQPPPRQVSHRDEPPPVRLNLFGGVRLFVDDQEIVTGLRTASRELLLYLGVHPAGATLDQTIADLWPDDDLDTARETFHAAARTIRKTLRDTTKRRADFLLNTNGRYSLNPDLIDVDLWAMRQAARAYTHANNDDKATALQNIAETYTAELADGLSYPWLHAEREAARREALDALTTLAQIQEQHGQPEHAIATLETAIRHDPCGEEMYRRVMNLHANAGRTDAARRTYRLLRIQLRTIGTDPEPATEQLIHSL